MTWPSHVQRPSGLYHQLLSLTSLPIIKGANGRCGLLGRDDHKGRKLTEIASARSSEIDEPDISDVDTTEISGSSISDASHMSEKTLGQYYRQSRDPGSFILFAAISDF